MKNVNLNNETIIDISYEKSQAIKWIIKTSFFGGLLAFSMLNTTFANSYSNNSSTNNSVKTWQPVASDKLIKLPANIIEKRIQKDFHASPMAMRMAELEGEMSSKVTNIKVLQKSVNSLEGKAKQDQNFELVQYKSEYLDLLQESHRLNQTALSTKQALYKNVLDKMRIQSGKVADSDAYKIKQAQLSARKRMEKVVAQVDQSLMHTGIEKPSEYSDEYTKNLDQIEKFKIAISRHQANKSPQLNGVDISSEEYLRQLLMDVSTEQSLLDQESLMLSYMAKLVALDAQALEYEVAYSKSQDSDETLEVSKPSNVTSLFYQD